MEVIIISILILILFVILWSSLRQPQEPKVIYIEPKPEPEPSISPVLPYWTLYGTPTYWPTYLSPYWFYDVPFTGPITGRGGYYRPHGPRFGYSGVAVGGGGGGHH